MQARYQYGNLTRRKRRKGPDVWQFRWMESGRLKSVIIGTVQILPSKADAERAVEYLRCKINVESPQQQFQTVTVCSLIDRFMAEYAPKRWRMNTAKNYGYLFRNHIRPRRGSEPTQAVKTLAVENWLDEYPHSRQVKSHIRNLMHTMFNVALRWELVERNPIDLVRQSSKRLETPRVLTPAEFQALIAELVEPYKTMVITVGCLGLRISELVALRWQDVDFQNLLIAVHGGFVRGEINDTKTEASEGVLPLDPDLAETLLRHRARSVYVADTDFVFAGDAGNPRWPETMLAKRVKPAALRAGIGNVGWDTFRHTYSTLRHSLGTTPAVQKELLRHANIQTTLNVYTQAVSEEKRLAASKGTRLLWQFVSAQNDDEP